MFPFRKIAERRIREAMERGEFDDLRGKGEPLPEDGAQYIPGDLRMAYKILKNAGFLPPEIEVEREIQTAMDLLDGLEDEQESYQKVNKLNLLVTKMNLIRSRPVELEKSQVYYQKIVERIRVRNRKRP
jgi:hypothetical protein